MERAQAAGLPTGNGPDAPQASKGERQEDRAPDALDLSQESPETLDLYGIGAKPTDTFGRQCLMARRLAESGVRYIQVTYGDSGANPAWDQHYELPKHGVNARAV